jgi:hypothetical protein
MLTRRLPLAVLLLGFPAGAAAMVATQFDAAPAPAPPAATAVAPAPASPAPRPALEPRPGQYEAAPRADRERRRQEERPERKRQPDRRKPDKRQPVARFVSAPAPIPAPVPTPPSCAETNDGFAIEPAAARTLTRAWSIPVAEGLAGAPVLADGCLYVATQDGEILAFNADTGERLWSAMPPDGVAQAATAAATEDGVVYTAEPGNRLKAFEADTGATLLDAQLPEGTPAGVTVGRGTVYAAVGERLVAFRPTATAGGQAVPAAPALPAPEPAVAATLRGFVPALVAQGEQLTLRNLDADVHDVVARDLGPDGQPLFRSAPGVLGAETPILGVENLAPGAYEFYCSLHPERTGTLFVGG